MNIFWTKLIQFSCNKWKITLPDEVIFMILKYVGQKHILKMLTNTALLMENPVHCSVPKLLFGPDFFAGGQCSSSQGLLRSWLSLVKQLFWWLLWWLLTLRCVNRPVCLNSSSLCLVQECKEGLYWNHFSHSNSCYGHIQNINRSYWSPCDMLALVWW